MNEQRLAELVEQGYAYGVASLDEAAEEWAAEGEEDIASLYDEAARLVRAGKR